MPLVFKVENVYVCIFQKVLLLGRLHAFNLSHSDTLVRHSVSDLQFAIGRKLENCIKLNFDQTVLETFERSFANTSCVNIKYHKVYRKSTDQTWHLSQKDYFHTQTPCINRNQGSRLTCGNNFQPCEIFTFPIVFTKNISDPLKTFLISNAIEHAFPHRHTRFLGGRPEQGKGFSEEEISRFALAQFGSCATITAKG